MAGFLFQVLRQLQLAFLQLVHPTVSQGPAHLTLSKCAAPIIDVRLSIVAVGWQAPRVCQLIHAPSKVLFGGWRPFKIST